MSGRSELNDLLDCVYGTIADPGQWPQMLTRVADHLGAIGGMLIYNAPEGARSFIVVGRLSEEISEVVLKRHVWNPWTLAMRKVPFGRAVAASALVSERALCKSAFYDEVLAPQGIVDTVNFSHRAMARDGSVGGIGIALSARGAPRTGEDLRRLQRLTPHLSRALDATLKLGALAEGVRSLTKVLQSMPNPALLLDGKGRVSHANPAAEALLRSGDGLTLDRNGGLQPAAALAAETGALSRTLAQALAVASGIGEELGEPIRLSRPSGAAPLLVLPVPLPPPAFALWDLSEQARVLLLILDPSAQPRAAASSLRATFGLTAAEARVAALIAGGLSGPQTAATLGVSPATVKTHLNRCFDKIDVRSQVALARLLGALPASAPGTDGFD
jgi:DNA-binding CsgD family transcriptional regulator/PAS domain-containing protein